MHNLLLQTLCPADLERLRPHLTSVSLARGDVIDHPGKPIEHIYFPEDGLISVMAGVDGDQVEVGIVGREGMTGLPVLFGWTETIHEGMVQIAGSAHRLPASTFRTLLDDNPALFRRLLLFAHVQLVQVAQTALANGRLTVEQRLARWLLMCQDRLRRDSIALTHDLLAIMLGVRRPGVTVALHVLEGNHAIRSRRGLVQILNRAKLKATAGSPYGKPEATYQKVFGVPIGFD